MLSTARRPFILLLALAACAAPLAAQARKPPARARPAAQPEKPPEALADSTLAEVPAGFTGSRFDALLKHLASPGAVGGLYAIRLAADSLCEEHPLKVSYQADTERLSILFDGGHSWNTPGIELGCTRKMTGTDATGPKGERFRATRIVERGQFVLPEQSDLRWQSHFELSVPMAKAEGAAASSRFAFYLVVLPTSAPPVAESDSTREAATPDRPDETITLTGRIRAAGVWLWVVDRATRRVVAKGPLLPGLCPG